MHRMAWTAAPVLTKGWLPWDRSIVKRERLSSNTSNTNLRHSYFLALLPEAWRSSPGQPYRSGAPAGKATRFRAASCRAWKWKSVVSLRIAGDACRKTRRTFRKMLLVSAKRFSLERLKLLRNYLHQSKDSTSATLINDITLVTSLTSLNREDDTRVMSDSDLIRVSRWSTRRFAMLCNKISEAIYLTLALSDVKWCQGGTSCPWIELSSIIFERRATITTTAVVVVMLDLHKSYLFHCQKRRLKYCFLLVVPLVLKCLIA
jgi:hypothetical protein